MTKSQDSSVEKNISNARRILVKVFVALSMLTAMFAGGIAVSNIDNYERPYLFGFVFAFIGLTVGIVSSVRLKNYLILDKKLNDLWTPATYISFGFIGAFLLAGALINKQLSTLDNCDRYRVLDKIRIERTTYLTISSDNLFVAINGKTHRILCGKLLWEKTSIGDKVNLCFYKSSLGFDYILVPDDEKRLSIY